MSSPRSARSARREAATIRVRHECKTHWVAKANERLTKLQKERIGGTPFKDLMNFTENNDLKISGDLLKELALRWDERRGGFRVGSNILSFTALDVCLTLGLRIVGEKIRCENEGNENENIIKGKLDPLDIFQELYYLTDDKDVDRFCRLYIKLGFVEFYFPNSKKSKREVNGPWFKLLDDLNSLQKYSWGFAVYDYLVRGLTHASDNLVNETVTGQTHITGCAAVLQVWAFEHIFLRTATVSTLTFPRVFKWLGVSLANSDLLHSFRHNLTVDELSATEEELKNDAVREALQFAPSGYVSWSQGIVNASLKQILDQNEALRQENVRMDARITAVSEAFEDMKTHYAGQKGESCSADEKKEDFTEEVHQMPPNSEVDTEDNEPLQLVVWGQTEVPMDAQKTDGETSNMYTRLRRSPRKRTTSDAMRSPYVEPKRKTRKK